jgi:RNA polymerase sigma factor (TIGR02999 family)
MAGNRMPESTREVTRLLHAWSAGDQEALAHLTPIIYGELRRLAVSYLRRERSGHSLQPTELIAEAYARLIEREEAGWESRTHFVAVAAHTMRQILVDFARRRGAGKRGGGHRAVTLDEGLAFPPDARFLELNEALEELSSFDERKARIVDWHYFGGLTQEEIACLLSVHVNTVARDLRIAHAWLRSRMEGNG